LTEETKRKQGKPWTNEAVFKTYEEAFVLVQEINEMSAISEKKVRAKIKRRANDKFVVKVRLIKDDKAKQEND
tara:strand:+ start:435 stop:653 length:219 start_codon:yes stop_codon:yes gene_type:complete